MTDHTLTKKIVWLVGTLLIGALGSGLWEAALKPGLFWVGNFMLDIATLGLNSLRDGMYADAAKGGYERAGLGIFAMAVGLFTGMLLGPLIVRLRQNARDEQQTSTRIIKLMRSNWALWAFPVAIGFIMFVQLFRVSYITRAANYIEQLQRIVAPYQSSEERITTDSRFAQITSRAEYFSLAHDLRQIAKENSVSVPEFDIY